MPGKLQIMTALPWRAATDIPRCEIDISENAGPLFLLLHCNALHNLTTRIILAQSAPRQGKGCAFSPVNKASP